MIEGYENNADLPARVRTHLSEAAQSVYRLAYNSAIAAGDVEENADWAANKAVAEYLKKEGS